MLAMESYCHAPSSSSPAIPPFSPHPYQSIYAPAPLTGEMPRGLSKRAARVYTAYHAYASDPELTQPSVRELCRRVLSMHDSTLAKAHQELVDRDLVVLTPRRSHGRVAVFSPGVRLRNSFGTEARAAGFCGQNCGQNCGAKAIANVFNVNDLYQHAIEHKQAVGAETSTGSPLQAASTPRRDPVPIRQDVQVAPPSTAQDDASARSARIRERVAGGDRQGPPSARLKRVQAGKRQDNQRIRKEREQEVEFFRRYYQDVHRQVYGAPVPIRNSKADRSLVQKDMDLYGIPELYAYADLFIREHDPHDSLIRQNGKTMAMFHTRLPQLTMASDSSSFQRLVTRFRRVINEAQADGGDA